MVVFGDEFIDFAGKSDDVGCEGETTKVLPRFRVVDFIAIDLLFINSRMTFMTLVLTIKSGWLKYFMASKAIG